MTYADWWDDFARNDPSVLKGHATAEIVVDMLHLATRKAYIAGMQEVVDAIRLRREIDQVKVAYVLCDNCEQYHEPSEPCALTEDRSKG